MRMTLERMDYLSRRSLGDPGELVGCARSDSLAVPGKLHRMNGVAVDTGKIVQELVVFEVPDKYFAAATGISSSSDQELSVRAKIQGRDAVHERRNGIIAPKRLGQLPITGNVPKG